MGIPLRDQVVESPQFPEVVFREKMLTVESFPWTNDVLQRSPKDLVEGAPKPVKTGVPKAEAEEMQKKLSAAGASVELK